jgi:hypothetical protein
LPLSVSSSDCPSKPELNGGDAASGPATVIRDITLGRVTARGINRYLDVEDGGGAPLHHIRRGRLAEGEGRAAA